MGFFSKLFGNKNNNININNNNNTNNNDSNKNNYQKENFNSTSSTSSTNSSKLTLEKEESLKKLTLRKESINKICLKKKELTDLTARVAVVMDYSGSMDTLYRNGTVQSVLERLLPLALKFDDNGELETWIFESRFKRLKDININNYYDYIKNEDILRKYDMGGTNYAPVMRDVLNKYTKEDPSDTIPTLVLFLTDGDNFDKKQTEEVIKKASKYPIFWQFVGLGNSRYSFLESLDEMEGRYIDNANFFAVNNINKISDDELYSKLLNEYPSWIKEAREKNILK